MSVQYAGNQFMSSRLIVAIQELRDYLGPEAQLGRSATSREAPIIWGAPCWAAFMNLHNVRRHPVSNGYCR